jgi:hypothetical protein
VDSAPNRPHDRAVQFTPPLLERFSVSGMLGTGSTGVVWRAHDHELGMEVALKTLGQLSPHARLALKDEYRVRHGISHEHLVECFGLLENGEQYLLVMELIEGPDLLSFVRAEGPCALPQLAAQLMRGLERLHAAGVVHRDIKPANLLVAPGPRLVLVDFGFAEARGRPSEGVGRSAGTFAYLAPERLRGRAASPASDIYAAGLSLFEAVAGRATFDGDRQSVILAKTLRRAPGLSSVAPTCEPTLAVVVDATLARDPSVRPSAAELLELLDATPADLTLGGATQPSSPTGRMRELEQLRAAWARARAGDPVLLEVVGESGIGKTTLLEYFVEECSHADAALVLRGRCYPAASLAHALLDEAIDQLAAWLSTLDDERRSEVLPPGLASLARMFPVLEILPELKVEAPVVPVDPQAILAEATQAFAELIGRVRRERTLLLWIDDTHWGDHDSVPLLRATAEIDDVEHGMLVLLSRRTGEGERLLARQLVPECLTLAPLDDATLEMTVGLPVGEREGLYRASGGNPFVAGLLRTLIEHESDLSLGLAELLRRKLVTLDASERKLLELLCVAGEPLPRRLALCSLAVGHRWPIVQSLLRGGWLRIAKSVGELALEPQHHRLREAVLEQLEPERIVAHHLELAAILQSTAEPDAVRLFRHLRGGGRLGEAYDYALRGAQAAGALLAFDREAQLYAEASTLELDGIDRGDLARRRAEALVNDGRAAEAADEFVRAASLLHDPSDPRGFELRTRAGEQLLRGGRFERGLGLLRESLQAQGETLPRSQALAVLEVLWQRLALHLRRRELLSPPEPRARPPGIASDDTRTAALWRTSTSLATLEPLLANVLATRHLLRSLRGGDLRRRLQAIGYEATIRASLAGPLAHAETTQLLAQVEQLAEGGEPYDQAWLRVCQGVVAYFECRFPDVVAAMHDAEQVFVRHCVGIDWELGQCRGFSLTSLAWMGSLRLLQHRHAHSLRWSDGRDDQFLASELRLGMPTLASLARDEPDRVLADADQILARWPEQPFPLPRYLAVLSVCMAHLYLGQPQDAWATLHTAWPRLVRAGYLRLPFPRCELLFLRARVGLGLPQRETSQRVRTLVRQDIAALERSTMPSATAFAAMLRGEVGARNGQVERMLIELREASAAFARLGMQAHRRAAELRIARATGNSQLAGEVEAWATSERVRDLERFSRVFLAGGGPQDQ